MHAERHLPIEGTYNLRDLGGYATASGSTRFRRLLRADALHRLDEAGIAAVVETGVTTIIDLRHSEELKDQPNPFFAHDRVAYHNVSLLEGLAPDLMAPGDLLLELYQLALTERQAQVARILERIAEAPAGVVLFHCTAGKDRTGVIAALLLGLAGVEIADIVADYARTAELIAPLVHELTQGAAARGADPRGFARLLASEPATMLATLSFIDTRYGSIEAYLKTIGLSETVITRLRNRLLGDL